VKEILTNLNEKLISMCKVRNKSYVTKQSIRFVCHPLFKSLSWSAIRRGISLPRGYFPLPFPTSFLLSAIVWWLTPMDSGEGDAGGHLSFLYDVCCSNRARCFDFCGPHI